MVKKRSDREQGNFHLKVLLEFYASLHTVYGKSGEQG